MGKTAGSNNNKERGVLRSLDWVTILIYIALLTFGWISVCGASYTYGDTDLFSLSTRSGMQIVWIGTSLLLALTLLLLDDRYYDTFAYVIFGFLLLLLFATIFNPHSIKGSHSWLVLGPLRLPPAEFAKFATALALAKLMSRYNYDIHNWKDFGQALAIIIVPMLFIVMQRLEFVEAMHLFGVSPDDITVVIHPQSVIHSMVELVDGTVIAQMGVPDMGLPIQLALTYPERMPSMFEHLDFYKLRDLSFEAPDYEKTPCLKLAMDCARQGGTAACVMSAANEVAVHMFLRHALGYNRIYDAATGAVEKVGVVQNPDLETILEADQAARAYVLETYGK